MDSAAELQIMRRFGTPLYVFDTDEFAARTAAVRAALGEKTALCFSIKANPFLLGAPTAGFERVEVCSPGELTICENAGIDMEKVIFSGVSKTEADIRRALADGAGIFTCESPLQFERIVRAAGRSVPVLLRIADGSQFGMDADAAKRLIASGAANVVGLHYFTGTQKRKAQIIEKELAFLSGLLGQLKSETGFEPRHIEYGAGLAVDYFKDATDAADMALLREAAAHIRAFAEKYPLTVEMGRFFAASCGAYYTAVEDTKTNHGVNYAICDGGIHHVNYYGQTMAMQTPIMEVLGAQERGREPWALCGSLCTTADFLVRRAELPALRPGDVIALRRAGAYSVTECPGAFLSRRLPRVILYSKEGGARLVRGDLDTSVLNSPVQS